MTYLVTGGAGFIGSHLVDTLLKKGGRVRVLDNFSTGKKENLAHCLRHITLVKGDIRDPGLVRKMVDGVEAVFHLAALSSVLQSIDDPASTWEINVAGTWNLLEAARSAKVKRFVFISSSSVYGESKAVPFREDMLLQGESPYAASKLIGEQMCGLYYRLYQVPTVSLRYFNVFGPRQNPFSQYAAVIPSFTNSLLNGKKPTVYGDGNQTRDMIYIDDVVRATLLAAAVSKAKGKVINIGSGKRYTVNFFLEQVQLILRTKVSPQFLPRKQGDVLHTQADMYRAKNVLGFSPRIAFQKGLTDTVRWFVAAHRNLTSRPKEN